MKYPPHLYTIEIFFGPEIPVFFEHFHDPEMAGNVLRSLKVKLFGSHGQIQALRMFHQNKMVSQYLSTPTKPRWISMPPPDADGVRHIPPAHKLTARSTPKIVPPKKPPLLRI